MRLQSDIKGPSGMKPPQAVLQVGEGQSLCREKLPSIPWITPAVTMLVEVIHVTPEFLILVPVYLQVLVTSSVADCTVGPIGDRDIEFFFHDSCDLAGSDNIDNGVDPPS